MPKTLYLLDGMALVYRAHFAFIRRPIFTSKGVNTSALFGFANTLLDIVGSHQPTHLAVAFDTDAPTQRHEEFPAYKAQREAMPEDIRFALPHVRRLLEGFRVPVLILDGYEADDLIGTLVRRAEPEGFDCCMVTPDKDFGQLVTDQVWMLKPGRQGEPSEILKRADILQRWGIERPEQVIDILGLMGDASDNIPGVPGIGEKTASKLIAQYGSVENLLDHVGELKGKQKERIETHREQALLSKRLATIQLDVPIDVALEALACRERDDDVLKAFCAEFEFNAMGRRLFGEGFKAGRGFGADVSTGGEAGTQESGQGELGLGDVPSSVPFPAATPERPAWKTLREVAHDYKVVQNGTEWRALVARLKEQKRFCFDVETTGLDPKTARLLGVAFCFEAGTGYYVPVPEKDGNGFLESLRELLEDAATEKVGHNLKYDLSVLRWHGIGVEGRLFDTMLAHSLIEPDQRHGMDYLSEVYLGYAPIPITRLIGDKNTEPRSMTEIPLEQLAEYAAEDADVTWQLCMKLEPLLREREQEKVFYDIEAPLIPVLVAMEVEGVRVDAGVLAEFARLLASRMAEYKAGIHRLAGREFNLNSPKQLGEVLFDELKIGGKPKKTRTGQYATDEQTLQALSLEHDIVRLILDYRAATKLKSTYADTLPQAISPRSGRVHTTYNQLLTATGRLQSQDPNLQNIPIRTDLGQEIRKAFVPRDRDHVLLSADYSQIELRIIAALSRDPGLLEAFHQAQDIHAATAARVHGVALKEVTPEMRRIAKMVNFGIIYGISAFGLAQRLGLARQESAAIIESYFKQYPGVQHYMEATKRQARERGYVETVTGRRRYLRDISSANATVRGAAERTAINTPIQGTAADMIKVAMTRIYRDMRGRALKSRMLLQVHDELVFDLHRAEEADMRSLVEGHMKNAIPLDVPIVVEMGIGENWLEAH